MVFASIVEIFDANCLLGFELVRQIATRLDEVLLVGVRNVGEVLIRARDPAVTDEQTGQVPVRAGVLFVTVQDGLRNVRNVLSGVGFTSQIELMLIVSISSHLRIPMLFGVYSRRLG